MAYFAVHMRNNKTDEERIKKVAADNVDNATCKDFYYGGDWGWTGSEPWHNVSSNVKHIGRGYYKFFPETTGNKTKI